VFGYHEVWHVMVIAGSLCHYVLIVTLVLRT
jgi:predicted membrane channel-forming protein YqfA (hemolysin III family)